MGITMMLHSSKALGTRWPLWSWWAVQSTCPQPSVDQVTLITLIFFLDLSNGWSSHLLKLYSSVSEIFVAPNVLGSFKDGDNACKAFSMLFITQQALNTHELFSWMSTFHPFLPTLLNLVTYPFPSPPPTSIQVQGNSMDFIYVFIL